MPPRPSPPRLTHFLCIPLVTSTSKVQLQASLSTFREDVTENRTPENLDGIPKKAVRPLGTLHLTLGVMSLLTQERVDSALTLLRSLNLKDMLFNSKPVPAEGSKDVGKAKGRGPSESEPLKITLRGLVSMHTPSQTSILYAKPVDNDHLQLFCLKLREAFAAVDLLVPDTRPLLLHATIVNTIYIPGIRGKGSGHGKSTAKLTVDAREILERYEDFEWMSDVRVEKVAICRMGAKKLEDGCEEYVVEGAVQMP